MRKNFVKVFIRTEEQELQLNTFSSSIYNNNVVTQFRQFRMHVIKIIKRGGV